MIKKEEKDLSKLSGEKSIKPAPRYNLPIVQLNGNEGIFYKKVIGKEGVESFPLGKKIKGTMLKIRRVCNAFSKTSIISTNEHNTWKNKVTVFETILDEDRKPVKTRMIDSGQATDMKEKYDMKMTQVIYFLLELDKKEKEIVKLRVRGKGLGNLFEYWQLFKGKDEHVYNYITEITEYKAGKTPAGIDYFATNFARLQKVKDMDLIAEKIKEVAGKVQEIEDYYEQYTPPEEELEKGAKTTEVKEEDIPIIQVKEEVEEGKEEKKSKKDTKEILEGNDEEIDVSKIPY